MIDVFRYGFFVREVVAIGGSLLWMTGFFVLVSSIAFWMLATGYKLRR